MRSGHSPGQHRFLRMRLRRSCLAVPGSSPKMLAKAATLRPTRCSSTSRTPSRRWRRTTRRARTSSTRCTGHEWTAPTTGRAHQRRRDHWCFRDILYVVRAPGARSTASWCPRCKGPTTCTSSHHLLTQLEAELGLSQAHRARAADRERARRGEPARDRRRLATAPRRSSSGPATTPPTSASRSSPSARSTRATPATSGTTSSRGSSSPRGRAACRRSTARTRRSATSTASAQVAERSRAARLRRQVGAPPRPDRDPQRGLPALPGAVRPRRGAARGLPRGHDRGRAPRRGHVGGRDDRRGLAQDGRAGRRARPRGGHGSGADATGAS